MFTPLGPVPPPDGDYARECTPKELWGDGPWQQEPDHLDWEHLGYQCRLQRNSMTGTWNGYLAVPREFPLSRERAERLRCHGGVTYYGDYCPLFPPDGRTWLGFDCGHGFDYMPGLEAGLRLRRPGGALSRLFGERDHLQYRDLAYARKEVEGLAEQVFKIRLRRLRKRLRVFPADPAVLALVSGGPEAWHVLADRIEEQGCSDQALLDELRLVAKVAAIPQTGGEGE